MDDSGSITQSPKLDRELRAYSEWKRTLIRTMDDYRAWSRKHGLSSGESEQRIETCRSAVDSDRLTIAFVAEFSRGKTELINALFFADYGRRLLPSTAGRTTMCPTELFYDQEAEQPAYIRLLPIETRLQRDSLAELKKNPTSWVTHPLDLTSADQLAGCLQQVAQTRRVTLEEAERLGLHNPEQGQPPKDRQGTIQIPKWRHALISFPHPLLEQGLTILDTPGLNALGNEPELTLNMLPSAQAVLFVLAADAGVTRSDLEMWQSQIKGFKRSHRQGVMVVLNKVDVLWDELQDDIAIAASIEKQCNDTARVLSVPRRNIFPVSAQKGLLSKVKGNRTLLQKCGLPNLEEHLSREVLAARKEIIRDTISAEISHILESSIGVVSSKHKGILAQLSGLQGLSGKSVEVIEHLIRKTRQDEAAYIQEIRNFQASRQVLQKETGRLRRTLDLKRLEQRIDLAEQRMRGNWTTKGLKRNMRTLFDEMRGNMQLVANECEHVRTLIRSIYRRFQSDQRFSVIQPKMFSIMRFRVELEMLYQEAEIFRNSPTTAMTEKHFVIQRFFMAMVSRARLIFTTAYRELDSWMKTALEPLIFQIREHRAQMQSKLQDLKKISSSRDTLDARIAELQRQDRVTRQQLSTLRSMHTTLNGQCDPATGEHPRLTARRSASS